MLHIVLNVTHLLVALGLVGLVLIQHGRGADAGAAFGSGASSTVFGARGSASFLSRLTAGLATVFFLTSMAMGYFAMQAGDRADLMTRTPASVEARATPAVAPESDLPSVPPLGSPTSDLPEVPPLPQQGAMAVTPPQEESVPVDQDTLPTGEGPARGD